MPEAAKVFDKANSIIAIRQKGDAYQEAYARIRRVATALPDAGDPRTKLLRVACNDLLMEQPADGRPHFALRPHVVEEIHRLEDSQLERYLHYRYRYDMFPLLHQLDDYPPCLQIEPTSICNYRCVFCYQIDKTFTTPKNGHLGTMSLDRFKQVVDQAEGHIEAITLASRGEPLLCKDIDQMLAYTRGKFLALKINTNASMLDERKAHAILQAEPSTLVFSADAAEEPLYSELRVNGKLDKVLANIERFNEIRQREYPTSRLITRVSGVRFTEKQDFEQMEKFWGALVDQVAFVDYNPWEDTYDRAPSGVDAVCSDLWRRMFVWWDGTANPCDVDYRSTLAVGNSGEATLSELWRSEKYEALRRQHLSGGRKDAYPCNRCTVV